MAINMNIEFTVKDYFEELQLMDKQYAQEEALYPWVYMLLQMIECSKKEEDYKLSLKLIASARKANSIPGRQLLGGYKKESDIDLPFPDIAILDKRFDSTNGSEDNQLEFLYGCVECKKKDETLPNLKSGTYNITNNILKIIPIKPTTHYYFQKVLKNICSDAKVKIKDEEKLLNDISPNTTVELMDPKNALPSLVDTKQWSPIFTHNAKNIKINMEEYLKENSTIFVQKKVNRFFIKEAKTNSDYSPFDADLSELLGELLWYGRVLYTNGLIWTCFKITKLNYSSDDESNNLNLIELRKKLLHDKSFVFENLAFEIDVAEIADFTKKYHNSEDASTEWNELIAALAKIDWRQDPTVTIN